MHFISAVVFSFLCLLFCPVHSQTKCRTSGSWVLLSLPKSQLYPILPEGVFFDTHPFSEIPATSHPVFLEFNLQHDCWFFYIFPAPSMHEFKIQIPYTMSNNYTNFITKPLVLVDSWINTLGSKFFYGLPTYQVEFSGDGVNSFNMVNPKENISVKANFSYFGEKIEDINSTSYFFGTYTKINNNPWLTDETNFNEKDPHCASNKYFWNKNGATVQYMNASIELKWSVFNKTYKVESQELEVIGGIAVDVDMVISHRQKCSNFYKQKKIIEL